MNSPKTPIIFSHGDLTGIALFNPLSDKEKTALSAHIVVKQFPKNKILFLQGDKPDYCYFIQSGQVKLYRETLDGEQAVVDILTSPQFFGETALFDNDTYPYSAEAVTDVMLAALPLPIFKKTLEENAELSLALLQSISRQQKSHMKELEHLNVQSASQRIGCFLLQLCASDPSDNKILHLPYDKSLIAARLGMQPETFSRALHTLRKETYINVKGATVTIPSIHTLSTYCCNACSETFPCESH